MVELRGFWAVSSSGRALLWHSRGGRFESGTVHFNWVWGAGKPLAEQGALLFVEWKWFGSGWRSIGKER